MLRWLEVHRNWGIGCHYQRRQATTDWRGLTLRWFHGHVPNNFYPLGCPYGCWLGKSGSKQYLQFLCEAAHRGFEASNLILYVIDRFIKGKEPLYVCLQFLSLSLRRSAIFTIRDCSWAVASGNFLRHPYQSSISFEILVLMDWSRCSIPAPLIQLVRFPFNFGFNTQTVIFYVVLILWKRVCAVEVIYFSDLIVAWLYYFSSGLDFLSAFSINAFEAFLLSIFKS